MKLYILKVLIVLLVFMNVGFKDVQTAEVKKYPCRFECADYCQIHGKVTGYCWRGMCHCRLKYNVETEGVKTCHYRYSLNCAKFCQIKGTVASNCWPGLCSCKSG
nr:uncharacterized protein LOC113397210 [Vanessa tameamea]